MFWFLHQCCTIGSRDFGNCQTFLAAHTHLYIFMNLPCSSGRFRWTIGLLHRRK